MGLINKALEYLGYGDPPAREGYLYQAIISEDCGLVFITNDCEYFIDNPDYRLIAIYSTPDSTTYYYEFFGTPP